MICFLVSSNSEGERRSSSLSSCNSRSRSASDRVSFAGVAAGVKAILLAGVRLLRGESKPPRTALPMPQVVSLSSTPAALRLAMPTLHAWTFDAKRKDETVSPRCLKHGEMLTNIKAFDSPPKESFKSIVRRELRYGT